MERIVNISSFSSLQIVSTVFAAYFQKKITECTEIFCVCVVVTVVLLAHKYTQYRPKMTVLRPDKRNIALGLPSV